MDETRELEDIWAANRDLEKRLEKSRISLDYDEEFDILLLTIGEPEEALTEEIRDGLHVRVRPDTLEIVGFEILGFRRRFLRKHPEFTKHFEILFEQSPLDSRLVDPRTARGQRARQAVRELIAV